MATIDLAGKTYTLAFNIGTARKLQHIANIGTRQLETTLVELDALLGDPFGIAEALKVLTSGQRDAADWEQIENTLDGDKLGEAGAAIAEAVCEFLGKFQPAQLEAVRQMLERRKDTQDQIADQLRQQIDANLDQLIDDHFAKVSEQIDAELANLTGK